MREILRYQISGSIYLIWVVIFYYGVNAENLNELSKFLLKDLSILKDSALVILGVAIALPLGVLIHQFSVLIKNWISSKICSDLSDLPRKEIILKLKEPENEKITTYVLERISNLNTFYYVRFDNGILSPLLAWFTISCIMGKEINTLWLIYALVIAFFTCIYIIRICSEFETYNDILLSEQTKELSIYMRINDWFRKF